MVSAEYAKKVLDMVETSLQPKSLSDMTEDDLIQKQQQLYSQRADIIERLADISHQPAQFEACDDYSWFSIQNHTGHELELQDTDGKLILYCHACKRIVAELEG